MKEIFLWIAVCSSSSMDSCTVGTFFKSAEANAPFECAKEEKIAVKELKASGVYFKHGCKTLAEFEREGL